MNLLELFAGHRCIGIEAEKLNFNVFSVDWKPYKNINLVKDIEFLQADEIPFIPDVIWASPDCTTYSIAQAGYHRKGQKPLTEYAVKSDRINIKLWELIDFYSKLNPDLTYFIENPMGLMRKMDFTLFKQKTTIWYCRYGDFRAKPTDIWTNSIKWKPRPPCSNNNKFCQHERCPRSSDNTGTIKLKKEARSYIPEQLCIEILKSTLI